MTKFFLQYLTKLTVKFLLLHLKENLKDNYHSKLKRFHKKTIQDKIKPVFDF